MTSSMQFSLSSTTKLLLHHALVCRRSSTSVVIQFVGCLVALLFFATSSSGLVVHGIIDHHSTASDWARVADFCFTFNGKQRGTVISEVEVGSAGHELALVGDLRSILQHPSLIDFRPNGLRLLQDALDGHRRILSGDPGDGGHRSCLEDGNRGLPSSPQGSAAVKRGRRFMLASDDAGALNLPESANSSVTSETDKSRDTTSNISITTTHPIDGIPPANSPAVLGLERGVSAHNPGSELRDGNVNLALNEAGNRTAKELIDDSIVSRSLMRTLARPVEDEPIRLVATREQPERKEPTTTTKFPNIKFHNRPLGAPIGASTVCQALRETSKITEQLTFMGKRVEYRLSLLVEPTLSPPEVTAVITRCGQQPSVAYRIEMTNPGGFLTAQFSCHDQGLLEFFGFLTISCAACVVPLWRLFRSLGYSRKESPVVDVFFVGALSMATYIVMNFLHLTIYASNGTGAVVLYFLGHLAYTGFLAAACGTIFLLKQPIRSTRQRWRHQDFRAVVVSPSISGTTTPDLSRISAAGSQESRNPPRKGSSFPTSSAPTETASELVTLYCSRTRLVVRYLVNSVPDLENLIILLFAVWFLGFLMGWISGDPTREPLTPLWRFIHPHRIRFYAISDLKSSVLLTITWVMIATRIALAGHFFFPSLKYMRRLSGEYTADQKRQFTPHAVAFVWLLVLPIIALCSRFIGHSHIPLLLCSIADIGALLLFAVELKRNPYFLVPTPKVPEPGVGTRGADDAVPDFEKVGLVSRTGSGTVPPSLRLGDQDHQRHLFPTRFNSDDIPDQGRPKAQGTRSTSPTSREGSRRGGAAVTPGQCEAPSCEQNNNPLAAAGPIADVAPPLLDMTVLQRPQLEPDEGLLVSRATLLGVSTSVAVVPRNKAESKQPAVVATDNGAPPLRNDSNADDSAIFQSLFGTPQR